MFARHKFLRVIALRISDERKCMIVTLTVLDRSRRFVIKLLPRIICNRLKLNSLILSYSDFFIFIVLVISLPHIELIWLELPTSLFLLLVFFVMMEMLGRSTPTEAKHLWKVFRQSPTDSTPSSYLQPFCCPIVLSSLPIRSPTVEVKSGPL